MKQLILKLVLPLTIVTFFAFTRSICAEVVDAPNSSLQGFPLPYICNGWGSSMSWQFFVIEFVVDFFIYFLFLSLLIYLIDRFVFRIKPNKAVFITLYVIAALVLCLQILIYSRDTTFYIHRDFDIKIIESKFGFFFQSFPHCY
jgi:hypothetical protein